MIARRLLLVGVLVVATSGCTFQQYIALTTHTVTESQLTVDGQPTNDLAYYDSYTRTVHLDPAAIASYEKDYPGTTVWVPAHEYGHAIADDIGFHYGDEPYPAGAADAAWPPAERAAQCVAEVELGHGPPWVNNAEGYWDCPAAYVASTRALMLSHGITP